MITYADLQRIYRAEKASVELQKVDENFYTDVQSLISTVGAEHREYVEKLSYELFERRRNKIVLNALRPGDKGSSNMTATEVFFFEEVSRALSGHRARTFNEAGGPGGIEQPDSKIIKKTKIKFLSPLPAIIGSDMVHYGPFKEGDEAELPSDNARVLVEKDIAEEA
jgi:DNA replication initiation complex subunit (GINS family)